jgi:hypothetical protein
MPIEHRAILNRKAKGESKGSNPVPLKVYQGQAQQEVAQTIGGRAPLTKGKVSVSKDSIVQADRAYGREISPRSFVISFVILLYAIS